MTKEGALRAKSLMRFSPLCAASIFILAGAGGPASVSASQPDAACSSHDYSSMQKLAEEAFQAVDRGDRAAFLEAAAAIRACMVFEVSVTSTLTQTSAGVVQKITGTGNARIPMCPDMEEAGYTFTSGPNGVVSNMVWTNVSIVAPNCTMKIVPSLPSGYNFWLGLTPGTTPAAALVLSEDGGGNEEEEEMFDEQMTMPGAGGMFQAPRASGGSPGQQRAGGAELHIVTANCKQSGGPGISTMAQGMPTPMPIFGPAWLALYGEGELEDPVIASGKPQVAPSIDPRALSSMQGMSQQDMMAQLQKDPNALNQMMAGVVPGLDDRLAAAEDNFMIKLTARPTAGNDLFASYQVSRTKPLKGGAGMVQELTAIVVRHTPPSPGTVSADSGEACMPGVGY